MDELELEVELEPKTPEEIVCDLIEGNLTEEDYFSSRIDSAGKVSTNLPELNLLAQDMNLFGRYLLSLSLNGRMRILLHHQLLGLSTKDLFLKYAIHSEKLGYLKGQLPWQNKKEKRKAKEKDAEKSQGRIRLVQNSQAISNELSATLAIFSRLPVSWVQNSIPKQIWDVDHFHDIKDARLTLEQLMDYLLKSEKEAKPKRHSKPGISWIYDIRGVILDLGNSHPVYIRVAIYELGGYVIEFFGGNNELYAFKILMEEISARFGPIETGYVETVIKERINLVIVCKSRSMTFNPPIYLKPFSIELDSV